MRRRSVFVLFVILLLLPVAALLSIGIGRYPVAPPTVAQILLDRLLGQDMSQYSAPVLTVVFTLRLPRIAADVLVGAGLAVSGAVYQAIFQNRLVSSDILGVSNGASVGAALAMLWGWNQIMVQGMAFLFGIGAVCFAILLASAFRERGSLTLMLSGMIISGLLSSALSFIKFSADTNNTLPEIVYWLMGSMASVTLSSVRAIALPVLICLLILSAVSWEINVISMGENEAKLLGVNVICIKILCILCATMLTVCSVCISGVIGWFGLMVPHVGRLIVGDDNRLLIPCCLACGGLLMIVMDTIARTAFLSELPIGILTGSVGAIVFSVLILSGRRTYEA